MVYDDEFLTADMAATMWFVDSSSVDTLMR